MILNKLLFNTDAVIALTFWLLLLMSVLSWAVIFNKLVQYNLIAKKLAKGEAKSFQTTGKEEQDLYLFKEKLESGLVTLATIGSSAPFIGLFGTVWGIYFALIDISASGSASIDVVAKPMGEALVATAFGLFAAIPAVIAFNVFKVKGRSLLQKLRFLID